MLKLMIETKQETGEPIVIEINTECLSNKEGESLWVDDFLKVDLPVVCTPCETERSNVITLNQPDVAQGSTLVSSTVGGYVTHVDQNIVRVTDYSKTTNTLNLKNKSKNLKRHKIKKPVHDSNRLKKSSHVPLTEKQISCQLCKKAFKNIRYLKKHQKVHKNEKPFKCSKCSTRFTRQSNLRRHLVIHTKNINTFSEENSIECSTCGKTFKRVHNLKKHLQMHLLAKPHKCTSCTETFVRLRDLKRHSHRHSKTKTYSCSSCPLSFRLVSSLRRHVRKHKNENTNPPIIKSDVSENNNSLLSSDIKIFSGLDSYEAFTQEFSNNFICDNINDDLLECFLDNINKIEEESLLKELPEQKKDTSYLCDKCCKTFKHKENLRKHLKTHSGERPHKCVTCDKGFLRLTDLKRHALTHTVDRPYICRWCKVSYRQSETLKKHINRVHV